MNDSFWTIKKGPGPIIAVACGWRIPNHAAMGVRDRSISLRHTGMVAEFCVWRPVNTKSAVRDSGISSLMGRLGGPIETVPGSHQILHLQRLPPESGPPGGIMGSILTSLCAIYIKVTLQTKNKATPKGGHAVRGPPGTGMGAADMNCSTEELCQKRLKYLFAVYTVASGFHHLYSLKTANHLIHQCSLETRHSVTTAAR